MIIPVRCFTCNNVLASKYKKYKELNETNNSTLDEDILSQLDDSGNISKKIDSSYEIFNQLGIKRYCCKRHLLTHVDLIEKI